MATLSKGITLVPDSNLKKATNSTIISYYDNNYQQTLRSTLGGVEDTVDLLSAIDEVWVPLGSGTVIAEDGIYPIKNFNTDYNEYLVVAHSLKVADLQADIFIEFSKDNAITISSDSMSHLYYRNAFGTSDTYFGNQNSAFITTNMVKSGQDDDEVELGFELYLKKPAHSDHNMLGILRGNSIIIPPGTGATVQGKTCFCSRVMAAYNAILLTTNNGITAAPWAFTGGQVNVWGKV